jgi:hypothetical protein
MSGKKFGARDSQSVYRESSCKYVVHVSEMQTISLASRVLNCVVRNAEMHSKQMPLLKFSKPGMIWRLQCGGMSGGVTE